MPSLDAWAATSTNSGASWTATRVSNVTSNPNFEQFSDRTVPFAGDYLYVSSVNDFSYGVWTDWRNTVQGTDPREDPEDEDGATADVHQCRVFEDADASERRPLPARRRHRPEHLRRLHAVAKPNTRNEKGAPRGAPFRTARSLSAPYIIPPMSGIPPPAIAGCFSGTSATTASVVRMFFAIDAAFCSARRVTLVGSMIPAFTRSS